MARFTKANNPGAKRGAKKVGASPHRGAAKAGAATMAKAGKPGTKKGRK